MKREAVREKDATHSLLGWSGRINLYLFLFREVEVCNMTAARRERERVRVCMSQIDGFERSF